MVKCKFNHVHFRFTVFLFLPYAIRIKTATRLDLGDFVMWLVTERTKKKENQTKKKEKEKTKRKPLKFIQKVSTLILYIKFLQKSTQTKVMKNLTFWLQNTF